MNRLLIIFLFFTSYTYAWNPKADSLKKLLYGASDSLKAEIYFQIGYSYEHCEPETALFYYQKAKKSL